MSDTFLNCDWGTSRFRLRLVHTANGAVLGQCGSDDGSAQLAADSNPETRESLFRSVLDLHVSRLGSKLSTDLCGVPVLISGMASSSIGWREVPYADLPFAVDGSDVVWQKMAPSDNGHHRQSASVFLLSGVRSDGDIMRGEETELIGLGALPVGSPLFDKALVILPGTHSKHIHVVDGRIVAFQTHMTGELFGLLRRHSSLRHSTGTSDDVLERLDQMDGPLAEAFCEGVRRARTNAMAANLFQVRVRQLLQGCDTESNTAFLSGLLIGDEISALCEQGDKGRPILLCARCRLSRPYCIAAEALGLGDRVTVVPPNDSDRLSALGQAVVLKRITEASESRSHVVEMHGIGIPSQHRRVDGVTGFAWRPAQFDWDRFRQVPVVGILRGFTCQEAENLVRAAAVGGLIHVEVTMNTPNAVQQIGYLRKLFGNEVVVGAGTVCTLEDFRLATEAGASFIVTPAVVPEVIEAGVAAEIPVFAGAMTPSEILNAWQLGAAMVKIFPADQLGPAFIRNIRGPFPQVRLMPTGGVTVETIDAYRQAGADAFGVGSPLFSKSHATAGDWQWITSQARRFTQAFVHGPSADASGQFRGRIHQPMKLEPPN